MNDDMYKEIGTYINAIFDLNFAPWLVGIFLLLFLFETISVLRIRKQDRKKRTITNVLFSLQGFLTLRFLLLPAMVWVAFKNQDLKFGLNFLYEFNPWVEGAIAFLLLDFSNYAWHIINHRSDFLWRFHLVHHTDLDLDVTTAIRFHGGELAMSVFYRGLLVLIVGATPIVVLVYEFFFEAATQFHHSNWRIPLHIERIINKIVVTPRMHGIHHSIIRKETDSNFSVIFSIWDRIGKTLNLNIHQRDVVIGVPVYDDPHELTFSRLIKMPFTRIRQWKGDGTARGKQKDKLLD